MKLNQLIYFSTVCKCNNNITKASKELFVSQPAISLAIKELESEFSTQFFIRKNNVLTLTDQGLFFYDHCQKIIEEYQLLKNGMHDMVNENMELKVGIPPMIGTLLFPEILEGFNNKYPKINFDISEHGSLYNQEAVLNGEIDLAIVVYDDNHKNNKLNYYKLKETNLILCVNKKNKFANKKYINLKDLKDTPLILMKEDSLQHKLITEQFKEENITPTIKLCSNQLYTIKRLLNYEDNGAFLFEDIIKNDDTLVGINLNPPAILNIGLIWLKRYKLSNNEMLFLNFVKKNIKLFSN